MLYPESVFFQSYHRFVVVLCRSFAYAKQPCLWIVGLYCVLMSSWDKFLFLFWEISADWQIIKNCVILYLLRVRVLYTFLEISLFRLERGFFFYRSWTYWHCHVENVSGLIDATVIPIFDLPCVPYKYIIAYCVLLVNTLLEIFSIFMRFIFQYILVFPLVEPVMLCK